MAVITKTFPLLTEIDEQINFDNLDWNKNAFQTLLTSNLPLTTIVYYAIDVGLRRLDNSLYEAYWDVTVDALNDLTHFLFTISSNNQIDSYLYEAKCQLLMYASIAVIKFNTIRRRSINEAKLECATMFLLLLEKSKSYENPSIKNEYSSCTCLMRLRYLKRIFLIGQWLSTLSKNQLHDIQSNYERYLETMINHLYTTVSLRDHINGFIDRCLLNNSDENDPANQDADSSDFVLIQRFPKFNEKTIEQNNNLMYQGFLNTLNQLNNNHTRKLISCVWTLSCMIEGDRVSLPVLIGCIPGKQFSQSPIDFEQKPILIDSLNERDIIVFLLLCAQQNIRLPGGDSILHPYLLYMPSSLCTQDQRKWWQTAIEEISCLTFVDHLATIRLDEERVKQYPPNLIILQTAKILFKITQIAYEQRSSYSPSSYEQYAIQYFQTAKTRMNKSIDSLMNQGNRYEKFFFYPQKIFNDYSEEYRNSIGQLMYECEQFTRQCDELKLLPQPETPRSSNLTTIEQDFNNQSFLTSLSSMERHISNVDPTIFVTPTSIKNHDISTQTSHQEQSSPIIFESSVEEIIETSPLPSLPPIVDMLFSHMNGVNQWINDFCIRNEGIQNDINAIRDRLEKLNRATSQMIFSNVSIFQSNSNANIGSFHPPH